MVTQLRTSIGKKFTLAADTVDTLDVVALSGGYVGKGCRIHCWGDGLSTAKGVYFQINGTAASGGPELRGAAAGFDEFAVFECDNVQIANITLLRNSANSTIVYVTVW